MAENEVKNNSAGSHQVGPPQVEHQGSEGLGVTGQKSFRSTLIPVFCLLGIMTGLVVYSPELYNMFCQATGYGGATKQAQKAPDEILDQTVLVRFDATVASNLQWSFKPVERLKRVRVGAQVLAYYRAENLSDKPIIGTATYNVTPEIAGSYFNKIDCFCFTEQRLAPKEIVDMAVIFFIDPDMVKDKEGRVIKEITLSYIFHRKKQPVKAVLQSGKNKNFENL